MAVEKNPQRCAARERKTFLDAEVRHIVAFLACLHVCLQQIAPKITFMTQSEGKFFCDVEILLTTEGLQRFRNQSMGVEQKRWAA